MAFTRNGSYETLAAIGFASLLWLAPGPAAVGQEQKTPGATASQPSVWMRTKLEFSRNILAGLASEDFDKVAANAQAMQGMSKFEGFIRGKMPGYRTQLEVFQDANEEIIRQAQKDNVEGAALAFTQLTISCVNCHKQLRAQAKRK
jgi:cytochrome c556